MICRCGHEADWHSHPKLGYLTCTLCRCPEFRLAETRKTLTLKGVGQ